MKLLDFQYSVVLTWTVAILLGVGVLGLCAALSYVLAMLQTGWFNVIWLGVCAIVAVAPWAVKTVRRVLRRPEGKSAIC